jgi:hypothetical protein
MRSWPRSLSLLAAAFLANAAPVAASEVKAVAELFTSQGCSSCPKADKLLGELVTDPRLIALSLPVDYWDYLGWRDTLALHAHSVRQKGYANNRGDRQVYTPQMVFNGTAEAIGSDHYAIERLVSKIESKSKLAVPVTLKRNGDNIDIEVGTGSGAASIWLISVTKRSPVAIERGENRGKTITYHNVVRSWVRIGEWKGGSTRASLAIAEIAQTGGDAAVVLIQSGTVEAPGPIRGAAMINLQ